MDKDTILMITSVISSLTAVVAIVANVITSKMNNKNQYNIKRMELYESQQIDITNNYLTSLQNVYTSVCLQDKKQVQIAVSFFINADVRLRMFLPKEVYEKLRGVSTNISNYAVNNHPNSPNNDGFTKQMEFIREMRVAQLVLIDYINDMVNRSQIHKNH